MNSFIFGGNDRLWSGRNRPGYRFVRIYLHLDHGGVCRARGLANNILQGKK